MGRSRGSATAATATGEESQSQSAKGGKGAFWHMKATSLSDFLHPAEARSLRLGSQRRVDGGVGARRRSTPGRAEGWDMGKGRRGRETTARHESDSDSQK